MSEYREAFKETKELVEYVRADRNAIALQIAFGATFHHRDEALIQEFTEVQAALIDIYNMRNDLFIKGYC